MRVDMCMCVWICVCACAYVTMLGGGGRRGEGGRRLFSVQLTFTGMNFDLHIR